MFAWPKNAVEIVNEIDDEFQMGWDTDSNITILTGFIEHVGQNSGWRFGCLDYHVKGIVGATGTVIDLGQNLR